MRKSLKRLWSSANSSAEIPLSSCHIDVAVVLLVYVFILAALNVHNIHYYHIGGDSGWAGMYLAERRTYAAMVQKVVSGDMFPTDFSQWSSDKPGFYIIEPVCLWIMGLLTYALGDVRYSFAAADCIFPSITFFSCYFLGMQVLRNKLLAVCFAALACARFDSLSLDFGAWTIPTLDASKGFSSKIDILGNIIFPFLRDDTYVLQRGWPSATRLFAPEMTNSFLSVALLLGYLTQEKKIRASIFTVYCALANYVYLYLSIYTSLLLFTLLFGMWLLKDIRGKQVAIHLAMYTAISFFHVYNALTFLEHPSFGDYAARIGLSSARRGPYDISADAFILCAILFLGGALFCGHKWRNKVILSSAKYGLLCMLPWALIALGETLTPYKLHFTRFSMYIFPIPQMLVCFIVVSCATRLRFPRCITTTLKCRIFSCTFQGYCILLIAWLIMHTAIYSFRTEVNTDRNVASVHIVSASTLSVLEYLRNTRFQGSVLSFSPKLNYDIPVFCTGIQIFFPFFVGSLLRNSSSDDLLVRGLCIARPSDTVAAITHIYPLLFGYYSGKLGHPSSSHVASILVKYEDIDCRAVEDAPDLIIESRNDPFILSPQQCNASVYPCYKRVLEDENVTIFEKQASPPPDS